MRARTVSFPEAYLSLKMGKAARMSGWKDKSLILVPEKKVYKGNVDHPLIKKYLDGLEGHEICATVPERFQLVYSPNDFKAVCSNGVVGPQVIDNYNITAEEMKSTQWIIYDFV